MDKIYKVAIVGGGASGLLSAVELTRGGRLDGESVIILERNDRVGKKLIATGNGQGNFSNLNMSEEFYHGDSDFIKKSVQNVLDINLVEYFKGIGIFLKADKNGKIYPVSKQASSALDIIRAYLSFKGVETRTSFFVKSIKKDGLFVLSDGTADIKAEKVILAFGGKSAKHFGTDGLSYSLATAFSHKLSKLYPSLVQLKTKESVKALKGLKEDVKLSVYDGDKFVKSFYGELLFCDYGVSGNSVFSASAYTSGLNNPKLKVEFLPDYEKDELQEIIKDKLSLTPFMDKSEILSGLINKRIGKVVLDRAKSQSPYSVACALKDFTLTVIGDTGFNNSQVTKGGILTDTVSPETFESLIEKGLYIVGECLNIDGDCGGYNLSFAFTSGILAGRAIKNGI